LKIFERLLHRFDVADVSGEVEYIRLVPNKTPDQFHVAAIAFDYLDIVLDGINVEEICAAGRMEGIQDCDGGAVLNEPNGQIASNEAKTTSD